MATTTSAAAQQSSSSSADSGLKLNAGLGFSSSSPAQRTYTTTTQAPTTTTTQAPTTTITTSQAAATTSSSSSSDGSWITGGYATFYYQYGAYGACGKVDPLPLALLSTPSSHYFASQIYPDSSPIVALAIARYGTGSNNAPDCGRQVEIKNDDNGKTVVATVADACPGCANYNSLDLSTGAFDQIADEATGVVPISWKFIS
ncbi:SPOSA6832_00659, partial [Sporobolomyces salmonicolor]